MVVGIVTRRPLVLQLHKTEEGQPEYAEFLHLPKRRLTDFCMYAVPRFPSLIIVASQAIFFACSHGVLHTVVLKLQQC